jgi:multidrug efflux pump subunit AcrB
VYYNENQKNEASNYAQMFIRLKPLELPEIDKLVNKLRSRFSSYPNAEIEVKQFEQGPPLEAPIAIRVFGENLDSLRSLATKVEEKMKSIPGTLYVNNPLQTYKTDIKININKDKAAMLGTPTAEIDKTVRLGLAGLSIASFQDEAGDDLAINVTLAKGQRASLDIFDKLYVSSMSGALIPLKQLAGIQFETSVPTINHFNKNRYITVTSFVQQGYNTQALTQTLMDDLSKMKKNARTRVMQSFSMRAMVQQTESLYNQILSKQHADS